MTPGAELLVEIVPDKYGFSDICSWRWSEQKGWKRQGEKKHDNLMEKNRLTDTSNGTVHSSRKPSFS